MSVLTNENRPIVYTLQWNSLSIAIEYTIGQVRHKDPITAEYGYIIGLDGSDANNPDDNLDIWLGNDRWSDKLFLLVQLKPIDLSQVVPLSLPYIFDEFKIIGAVKDLQSAIDLYCANMPAQYLGGIKEITLQDLNVFKSKFEHQNILNSYQQQILTSECLPNQKPRAKVVRSFVTPERGQKISIQDRFYVDIEQQDYQNIVECIEELQQRLLNGETIICRLGHQLPNRHYNDNPEISRLLAIGILDNGVVWCDDEFTYATPESIRWAEDAYQLIHQPRSWEVVSVCSNKEKGTGDCRPLRIYSICWVDPATHTAGFSEVQNGQFARVVQILEVDNRPAIHCTCGNGCDEKNAGLLIESQQTGDHNSSGETELDMSQRAAQRWLFNDLIRSGQQGRLLVEAEGNTDSGGGGGGPSKSAYAPLLDMAMKSKTGWPDVRKALLGMGTKEKDIPMIAEEYATMMSGSMGASDPMAETEEMKAAKLAQENQTYEARIKTAVDAAIKAIPVHPLVAQLEAKAQAEKAAAENAGKLIERITNECKVKFIHSGVEHDLTNVKKYPVDNVAASLKIVTDDIAKGAITTYESVALAMHYELKDIAAREPVINNESTAGRHVYSENKAHEGHRARAMQVSRDIVAQKPNGPDMIAEWDARAKKHAPTIEKFRKANMDRYGAVFVQASEAIERKDRVARPELMEAIAEAGIPLNEAILTNGQNVGIQALISENAFENFFWQWNDWMDLAGAVTAPELYTEDGKPIPNLPEAGDEIRFALRENIDPQDADDYEVREPGKSPIRDVKINRSYDSCPVKEYALMFQWELKRINALKARGIDYIGEGGEFIGNILARSFNKRFLRRVDNIGRQYNCARVAGTEDTVAGDLVSSNSITIDGVVVTYPNTVNGEAVPYPVTDIFRLKMDQPGNVGVDIIPRLLVEPEDDWYQNRRGVTQKDVLNSITFTMADATPVVIGKLDSKMRIQPAYYGQVPNCAVDYNNCVVVCAAGLNASALNLPENLFYSYVPLLSDGGNLVVIDFTTPGSTTEALHINNILNSFTTYAARTYQYNYVRPTILGGSTLFIEGLLTRAERWKAYYQQIGSELAERFEDGNWKGRLPGGPRLWGTNAPLLGGSGVAWLSAPGSVKVAISEGITQGTEDGITLTGAAENDPTKPTTGRRVYYRQCDGMKAARVRNVDTDFVYNEVTTVFKIKGATAIA